MADTHLPRASWLAFSKDDVRDVFTVMATPLQEGRALSADVCVGVGERVEKKSDRVGRSTFQTVRKIFQVLAKHGKNG